MQQIEKQLNILHVLIISCVLLGAYAFQFFLDEKPCPLCLLQRLGMIGVATGAVLNVKFGPHKAHYGLSLLSCVFGGFVALRQFLLHVCHGFPTFSHPFWGLSLYTWSFIVFSASVLFIGILLLVFDPQTESKEPQKLGRLGGIAFILLFFVAFANIFTTANLCGWGACE